MKCEVCRAEVSELRRGRCWGCYTRWVEARPVGLGAMCCVCNERRRDVLRSVELLGAWRPICHNCAARATKLSPMPESLDTLKQALSRERRREERRQGNPDMRVFQYERRKQERRRDMPGAAQAAVSEAAASSHEQHQNHDDTATAVQLGAQTAALPLGTASLPLGTASLPLGTASVPLGDAATLPPTDGLVGDIDRPPVTADNLDIDNLPRARAVTLDFDLTSIRDIGWME